MSPWRVINVAWWTVQKGKRKTRTGWGESLNYTYNQCILCLYWQWKYIQKTMYFYCWFFFLVFALCSLSQRFFLESMAESLILFSRSNPWVCPMQPYRFTTKRLFRLTSFCMPGVHGSWRASQSTGCSPRTTRSVPTCGLPIPSRHLTCSPLSESA